MTDPIKETQRVVKKAKRDGDRFIRQRVSTVDSIVKGTPPDRIINKEVRNIQSDVKRAGKDILGVPKKIMRKLKL